MKLSLSLVLTYAVATSAAVPSLTPDNFEQLTAGKAVFLKFFAPWCGHCKNMASDWEKLADDYAGNSGAIVAEVDCTAEGKPLCDAQGVRGFPSLKYGDPANLEDYSGGRDFASLSKFAEENLKPMCSPSNLDLCDDSKRKEIETLQAMPAKDLEEQISKKESEVSAAEDHFKAEVQKLQDTYQKLSADKEKTIADVKSSGLGLMKAVKAFKAKSSGHDEL